MVVRQKPETRTYSSFKQFMEKDDKPGDGDDYRMLNIRLRESTIKKIDKHCKEDSTTRTTWIRQTIIQKLKESDLI